MGALNGDPKVRELCGDIWEQLAERRLMQDDFNGYARAFTAAGIFHTPAVEHSRRNPGWSWLHGTGRSS